MIDNRRIDLNIMATNAIHMDNVSRNKNVNEGSRPRVYLNRGFVIGEI